MTIGKSPIKDKPLRHAGQSLEEERRKLIEDDFQSVATLALFYILMAVMQALDPAAGSKRCGAAKERDHCPSAVLIRMPR